jgi:predicted glycosyltransferase
MDCKVVGSPSVSKTTAGKLISVFDRAFQLARLVKRLEKKPRIAVSHGSRSQALASYLLGIPAVSLDDYEYSSRIFNLFVQKILTPYAIAKEGWGFFSGKVQHYPSLKEELYLWNGGNLQSDCSAYLQRDKVNILFRPASRFSHYSTELSENLQREIIERITLQHNSHVILFPRDPEQGKKIEECFQGSNVSITIPPQIFNGPALIAQSDIVICGGGTMSREASVLGTPSYSFFGGVIGGVDHHLINTGKLVLLRDSESIAKIHFDKKQNPANIVSKEGFNFVISFLYNYLQ